MWAWLPAKATTAPLTPHDPARGRRSSSSCAQRSRSSRATAAWASSRTNTDHRYERSARQVPRSTTAATWRPASSRSPARAKNPAATAWAWTGAPVQWLDGLRRRRRGSSSGSPRARTSSSRCDMRTLPVSGSRMRSPSAAASSMSCSAVVEPAAEQGEAGPAGLRRCSGGGAGRGSSRIARHDSSAASNAGEPCSSRALASSSSPSRVAVLVAGGLRRRRRSPGRSRPARRPVPGVHSTSWRASRQSSSVAGSPARRPSSRACSLSGPARGRSSATECWSSRASVAVSRASQRVVDAGRRRRARARARGRSRRAGSRTGRRAGRRRARRGRSASGSPAPVGDVGGVAEQAAGVDGAPGPGQRVGLGDEHVDQSAVVDVDGRVGQRGPEPAQVPGGLAEGERRAVGGGGPRAPTAPPGRARRRDGGDEVAGQIRRGDLAAAADRASSAEPMAWCSATRRAASTRSSSVSRSRSCAKPDSRRRSDEHAGRRPRSRAPPRRRPPSRRARRRRRRAAAPGPPTAAASSTAIGGVGQPVEPPVRSRRGRRRARCSPSRRPWPRAARAPGRRTGWPPVRRWMAAAVARLDRLARDPLDQLRARRRRRGRRRGGARRGWRAPPSRGAARGRSSSSR